MAPLAPPGYHCSESPVQPNSSMIPLARNTRKQGPALTGLWIETTLARVSGAVCQVIGLGVIGCVESSLNVATLMFGGTRSAAVPNGSDSCQLSSHCTCVHCWHPVMFTWCSAHEIDPRPRLQPSPTQGAAPCGLCWSFTPDEL